MATIKWTERSGNWTTAADWETGTVPGFGDDAVIDLAGNYTVSVTAPISVASLRVNNGGTTFSINDPGDTETVAGGVGNIGTLNIDTGFAPGGSSLALGGTLANGGTINIGNNGFNGGGIAQTTTISAAALANLGTINLVGNSNAGGARAILDVSGPAGFGTVGWLTGSVHVFANGLIHFASGGITTIARNSALEVQTSSGVVAIGADTSSNSALTGLARNDGQLTIGHGASVATNTDFSNTGTVEV